MRKNEVIQRTMNDSFVFQGECEPPYSDEPDYEEIVIAVLEASLQEVWSHQEIKTCEDFKYLNVECCETCHTFYAHYEMALFDLNDGSKVWLCCAMKIAIFRDAKK